MRALIIAGGTVDDRFACETIKNGGYEIILAADAGMDFLYRHHLTPDIIVGDMDSADSEVVSFFQQQEQVEFCVLSPQKDDTDTEYAVRDLIHRGATEITILGGTGTRLDHVLSNIGLLEIGLKENVFMELMDTHNRIQMTNHSLTIRKKNQFGKYVSLIPYTQKVEGVTLEGFLYPLTDYTMERGNSLGISNEIIGQEAQVTVTDGILLVVESRD